MMSKLDDAIKSAVNCAFYTPDVTFTVYTMDKDGETIAYVYNTEEVPPKNAELACVVELWDTNTVQIRYSGARSEWVHR